MRYRAVLAVAIAAIAPVALAGDTAIGTFHNAPVTIEVAGNGQLEGYLSQRMLWAKVRARVALMEAERVGLEVSQGEVDAAHAARLRMRGLTEETAGPLVAVGKAVRQALIAWQENPAEDENIYSTMLSPHGVTKETWKAFKETYGTPDSVKKLWVPEDAAELVGAGKESIRQDLLRQKIARQVSGKTLEATGKAWQAYLDTQPMKTGKQDLETQKFLYSQQRASEELDVWLAKLIASGQLSITATPIKDKLEARAREITLLSPGEN